MRKGILLLMLALLLPATLLAENKPLKLDVGGDIVIDPQGAVHDYKINTPLTPEVKKIVDAAVRKWRFEPVVRGGKPVTAKTGMFLSLLATPVEQGYALKIDRINFGGMRMVESWGSPPQYPREAQRAGVDAEVVVAVRINQNGDVLDVVALRSRLLNRKAGKKDDASMRKRFEQATVKAFRTSKYRPADIEGGEAAESTIVVPTTFCTGDHCTGWGEWQVADDTDSNRPVPWLPEDRQTFDLAGLGKGQSIVLDSPVRLKQSMDGKAL